jgi:pimeloyl-ACP methyl ester carboxylesterase
VFRRRRPPLPHAAARTGGGAYARLRDGITHFALEGPAQGRPLLLVHGATVPAWEFDVLLPHLHASGLRTLRFDLFGHGFSDRPRIDYTLDVFVRQAAELVDATDFPRPFAVLGHSVGAAIVAALAASWPDWVQRLVLVAPMLDYSGGSALARVLRWPGVGELLMDHVGVPLLARRRRRRYARMGLPHLAARFAEQASYDGFSRALLSMARCATLGDQALHYRALGATARDVLVLWGDRDEVTTASDIARLRALLPAHAYAEVPGAGHSVLLGDAARAMAAIAPFLQA